LFYVSGAEVAGPVKALTEGKHFNIPLRHDGRMLFCKAWNFGERAEIFHPGAKLDLLVQVDEDAYSRKRGYSPWCVVLKDVRISELASGRSNHPGSNDAIEQTGEIFAGETPDPASNQANTETS
jgi:hypothetical protein